MCVALKTQFLKQLPQELCQHIFLKKGEVFSPFYGFAPFLASKTALLSPYFGRCAVGFTSFHKL
jgi:hypothetical protein